MKTRRSKRIGEWQKEGEGEREGAEEEKWRERRIQSADYGDGSMQFLKQKKGNNKIDRWALTCSWPRCRGNEKKSKGKRDLQGKSRKVGEREM